MPVGHGSEITGHVPEIVGHDAEITGHALPKYALQRTDLALLDAREQHLQCLQRPRHLQADQMPAEAVGGVAAQRAAPFVAGAAARDAAPSRSATAA